MNPTKLTPGEIGLSLSAEVLRIKCPPAHRLVLAEIISLYAANSCCDASDRHFSDRLTISKDTASVAVQWLEDEGLVVKVTTRLAHGLYRTLTPVPAAIAAKAAANPYPENPGTYRQNPGTKPENPGTPQAGKSGHPHPEFPGTPTRKMPVGVPGNSGSNIPEQSPSTFQIVSNESLAGDEKKMEADFSADEVLTVEAEEVETASPSAFAIDPAPTKEKVAPKRKGSHGEALREGARTTTAGKGSKRGSKPEITFAESDLFDFGVFTAAFEGTDFALADLHYYHEKVKAWRDRKTGEEPRRRDWLATAKQFFLNDSHDNRLKIAPGTQHAHQHGAGGSGPESGGAATGYRSSRYSQ